MSSKEMMEILDILTEECAEVIQCVSKIRRFGLESCHPDNPEYTNAQHLIEELGDTSCMIELALGTALIGSDQDFRRAKLAKLEKLKKFSNIFKDTQ